MKTRITELLGIEYPIVQGGLQWLATAEFCSTVSNSGALGIINATIHANKESLVNEIRKIKSLTDKPFGVNISMLPHSENDLTAQYMEAVIEEKVPVIETSGRNPQPYVAALKSAGVKIIHKIPAVRFASKAQEAGVDAVTIVGFECGGHPGLDDVTTLALIPKAAQRLSIPVIAGGGFAGGHGLLSALALGAEAVAMGTRFVATTECPIHDNFKQWMLKANEADTTLILRSLRNPMRVMKNQASQKVQQMENEGASLQDLMPIIGGQGNRALQQKGDTENCIFAMGQAVGCINSVLSVQDVVEEVMVGARAKLALLNKRQRI